MKAADRLGFDIKNTEVALIGAKTAVLRKHDLSVAQYATLLTLRENPGISGAGIARACLVTPQASSAVLKTLETRGLVERVVDDFNRTGLKTTLTDQGATLLADADREVSAIEQRIFDALSPRQRDTLRSLLAACRDALEST